MQPEHILGMKLVANRLTSSGISLYLFNHLKAILMEIHTC